MKVINLVQRGTWRDVANAARTTVGLDYKSDGEPSDQWKQKMLLAEHSPIRLLTFSWMWEDIPSWVSVHFVRHKIGIEHFVKSQRSDRTGIPRDELPQGALVNHACVANAQTIINISRKRCCCQASQQTRDAWTLLLMEIREVDPVLFSVCVPECVYRGFCPEMKPCLNSCDPQRYFYTNHYRLKATPAKETAPGT